MLLRARPQGVVSAGSEAIVSVEGTASFPPQALDPAGSRPSAHGRVCAWKARAWDDNAMVNGAVNAAAAWFYAGSREAAAPIRGPLAFCKGVQLV